MGGGWGGRVNSENIKDLEANHSGEKSRAVWTPACRNTRRKMARLLRLLLWLAALSSLILAASCSAPPKMPLCHNFKLEEASVRQIQAAFANGKLTSVKLVQCYIDRIRQIQPLTNALLELNPDALRIAAALDAERKRMGSRGPLHGIPIVVKDNIATTDKLNTTAGSWALLGSLVPRDAGIVRRLRRAGAIILGKSNLSEFADFRANIYSEGWSGRGGQTHDAYVLPANPGGSSSGSAVMVAANMVTVAIGTETDGSVVAPSSRNMIVGLKPTLGLTSRAGVIPLALSQDTVGCMGKTVEDVAIVLDAIAGPDKRDRATREAAGHIRKPYKRFLKADSLKGVRLGVPRRILWEAPSTKLQLPALEAALVLMRKLGAAIVDPADIATIADLASAAGWTWMPNEYKVCLFEFKAQINKYLGDLLDSPVRSLSDIIEFNIANPKLELTEADPYQDILILSNNTTGLHDQGYLKALRDNRSNARERGIDAVLKKYKLDALVVPGDPSSSSTQPSAGAGYPIVTVPLAIDREGVPFGVNFIGTAWSEPKLLRIASAFERATKRRVPPSFLPICQFSKTVKDNSC